MNVTLVLSASVGTLLCGIMEIPQFALDCLYQILHFSSTGMVEVEHNSYLHVVLYSLVYQHQLSVG